MEINKECPECGEYFETYFDAVDHLLDIDEDFDPALILPNGYRLMIGSLLRVFFNDADDVEKIKKLAEETYLALFMAEMFPGSVNGIIQDSIIAQSMENIDDELKQLLKDGEE
jgi:hypothetical protein